MNIHLEASATNFGPNLTNFDTLASPGIDLSLDLLPGGPQALAFYDLNFTPACSAAVCNGEFVRGLNFGFVTAKTSTYPAAVSPCTCRPFVTP